ncbi:Diatom spindle kinesin-1 [Hyphodiscus hymeniophilus]|uniref:Kinesin-like protein n=1 Tax=Hyphodiscus hymeniophilus TaxID=353542 RepID=A0A9P6VG59_9HELO|nr:Diatom spindle kinesin-1 [Hyphodiscus hymeniophilus]
MNSFFSEYRTRFLKLIEQSELDAHEREVPEFDNPAMGTPDTLVCVRIRPMTDQEKENEHIQGVFEHAKGVVHLYEPRRRTNGKPEVNNSSFTLDEAYGPNDSTEDIYSNCVSELVEWGLQGGTGMLIAYGQTGSGKTFTVTGLEILLVEKMIEAQVSGTKEVRVCIFEVSGSKVLDLLNERNPLAVREDAFGTMQLNGVLEYSPKTSNEFFELIDTAKTLRTTASTTKNDESSRSHSICRMRIIDKESATADEGRIMLVDLAGSEASADTTQHSRERMTETREINKSLSVLKECISKRAQWSIARSEGKQKPIHVPYRTNKLTQVLKSAFDVHNTQTCKTIVVACITPSVLDVAHSKNTLRYAETLKVPIPKAEAMPFHEQIPITWSNKDVHEWILKNSGNPNINPKLLAPRDTGIQLCRLDQDEFIRRALLTKGVEHKQANLLYLRLWSLHIDSRALLNRPGGSVEQIKALQPKTNEVRKKIVKPGMFFNIRAGEMDQTVTCVMAMGEEKGGNGTWHCAVVRMAKDCKYSGAHELYVAEQVGVNVGRLDDELTLVYDSKTRYYYME